MRILLLTLVSLINAYILVAQNNKDLIRSEFSNMVHLAKINNVSLELDSSDLASSKAVRGGKTIININQVNNLVSSVASSYKTNIIRLIIAHELAHHMQFQENASFPNVLVSECQADLIAGFLLVQAIVKDGIVAGAHLTGNHTVSERAVSDAMNAIFILGDEYNETHPGREHRRLALRNGMNFGILWMAEYAINYPDNLSQVNTSAKKVYNQYNELISRIPGDNLITWSRREASKIVHTNLRDCRDIVVYNKLNWDTTATNPFLTYSQQIINLGNKRIRITYHNQLVYAHREDPQNSLYWDIQANQSKTHVLEPGKSKTVNGKIRWTATDISMPKFIGPGSIGSLYTCVSLQRVGSPDSDNQISYSTLSTIEEDTKEVNALEVIFSEQQDLSKFIAGVGSCFSEKCDYITYESKVKIGQGRTKLIYNRTENSLHMEIIIYEGKDKNESDRKFISISNDLEEILPSSAFGPVEPILNSRYRSIYDKQGNEIGDIYLERSSSNLYNVGINIYSTKGLDFVN
jgi:hypothetical protein